MANFEDMLGDSKKEEGGMSKDKYEAKMEVLENLRKMAMDMMSEGFDGPEGDMQSVTVEAPDQEGLAAGLDMAEEVIEDGPEAMMEGDSESYAPDSDDDDESPESIDEQIAMLEEKKRMMMGNR